MSVSVIGCDLDNINQDDFNQALLQALEKCQGDETCENIVQEEFDRQLEESEILINIESRLTELEEERQLEIQAKHHRSLEIGDELLTLLDSYNTEIEVFNIQTYPSIQEDNSTQITIIVDYIPTLENRNLTVKDDLDTAILESVDEEYALLEQEIIDYLNQLDEAFKIYLFKEEYNDVNSTDQITTLIDWEN